MTLSAPATLLTAAATLLAVLVALWTALRVAFTRGRVKIAPPATTGSPELECALRVQANTVEQRPADFQCCPKCGKEVERNPDRDDCRIHQTDVGEAEWCEPATYCGNCRRSFFPSDQEFGD